MVKQKVLAYVTREIEGQMQLLVFTHRDAPEAGIQVPAGSLEPGELPADGALRETFEESGLACVEVVGEVGRYTFFNPWQRQEQERHFIHLRTTASTTDRWLHIVSGGEQDKGMAFECYWHNLSEPVELSGREGDFLDKLNRT